MISKANYKSITITEETTFATDTQRNYFMVVPTTGTATIEFNDGGGLVPLAEGGFFEPLVVPVGTIKIVPSALGSCVVCISGNS
jgi:hypothetical protein